MAERLREIKISVEIDTNKWTYREEFTSLEAAVNFYNQTMYEVTNGNHTNLKLIEEVPE